MALLRTTCVCLVLLAAGCARERPAPEKLRLGVARIPVYALIYVAEDARLFEQEGLDLELVPFTAGRDAVDAMYRGEVDAATVYTTVVLLNLLEGRSPVALTTLHRAQGLSGLVARPEARIASFPDLRGKRIGITERTSSDFVFQLMLAEGGVRREECLVEGGDPDVLVQRLTAGELDAAVLWGQAFLSAAGTAGALPYRRLTSDSYTEVSFVATKPDLLKARREAFLRLLRALSRAEQLLAEDPERARRSIVARFPNLRSELADAVLEQARFELGLSNLAMFMLRQEGAWLGQSTTPPRPAPDLTGVLRPDLLLEVAPETVTALIDPPAPEAAR